MNITVPCEADCSSGVLAIVKAVGYVIGDAALQSVNQTGYTGNERAILTAAGFQVFSEPKYLISDNYLCAGDILLNEENHTCICVTDGIYAESSISGRGSSGETDKKSPIQLIAEVSESLFPTDGSTSLVTVDFYITTAESSDGSYSSADIVSPTSVTQTIACGLNGQSTIYSLDSKKIAEALNSFGDKYFVATLSTPAPRNANGNAVVRITSSGTFTWISGSPLRTLDTKYSCRKLTYTMNYNANGGSLGDVPAVAYRYYGHETPITSAVPIKSGYEFMGWATSADGDVAYKYGDSYGGDKDITLYAVWGASISSSNIELTPTGNIEIPGREYTINGSGSYIFCDHTYYYNLNYDITNILTSINPENPTIENIFTSVTVQPYFIENSLTVLESTPQQITKSKGLISVAVTTLAKAISNYKSNSSVELGVKFTFVRNRVTQTVDKTIVVNLSNFNFVDISLESIAYNPTNSNEYLIRLKVQYPASFSVLKAKNLYPYIYCGNNALVYVSREDISETISIFTYKANVSGTALTLKWVGDVLIYDTDWRSAYPSSEELTEEMIIDAPTSSSSPINILETGECEASEFIESDYTQGFFKGGVVVAKQFSETSRMALLPSGFEFKELIER